MNNKGQPQNGAADQGIGRESESGREKIFHNRKFFKGIGSKEILIEREVFGGRLEIRIGQMIGLREKIGGGGYLTHPFFPNNIGADG